MKIAICLYGYYNNKVDHNAGDNGFNYINEIVLKNNPNIDIFIHSWDVQNKDKILSNYNATKYEIEPQIDFIEVGRKEGIDSKLLTSGGFKSLSFFYSRSRVIKMAIKHANDNEFEYDCIITCRFDLGQRGGLHLGYNVAEMMFDPKLDMSFIYSAMWSQTNAGYADMWFYSNQENMNSLSSMYEATLNDYFKVNSEYEKILTSKWPDSSSINPYSNERFKDNPMSTMTYNKVHVINNHLLHKWHFIKTGLYQKSKFLPN